MFLQVFFQIQYTEEVQMRRFISVKHLREHLKYHQNITKKLWDFNQFPVYFSPLLNPPLASLIQQAAKHTAARPLPTHSGMGENISKNP